MARCSVKSTGTTLISSMEHICSCEANDCSTNQETSHLLCNSKVLYRVHNIPPLLPVLSQVNIPTRHISVKSILMLSYRQRLSFPSGFIPSGFSY